MIYVDKNVKRHIVENVEFGNMVTNTMLTQKSFISRRNLAFLRRINPAVSCSMVRVKNLNLKDEACICR